MSAPDHHLKRVEAANEKTVHQTAHKSGVDISRAKKTRILSMFGKVDIDPQYDYKAERRRNRE